MQDVFEITSHISTPLMLAGIFASVLFFIFRQILKKKIFPSFTKAAGYEVIKTIIDKIFLLALVSMFFGFAGYVITIIVQPNQAKKSLDQVSKDDAQGKVDIPISNQRNKKNINIINDYGLQQINQNPSIIINSDDSWTAIIPPTEEGVTLKSSNGKEFIFNSGDKVEILASGYVNIGRGSFGPNGESNYSDTTMDSPYKNHVGGLEMWIGDKSNRYFIGDHFFQRVDHSGIPTLRVIESHHGYSDGNSGAFKVLIKKLKNDREQ